MRHKRGGRIARISSSRRLGRSYKSPWIRLLHGKRLLERLQSQRRSPLRSSSSRLKNKQKVLPVYERWLLP